MAALWSGEWHLGSGRLILSGGFGAFGAHRHPAVQVTLALQGKLVVADGLSERTTRAVVIPSGAVHSLAPDGPSARALSIYLHPASRNAKRLISPSRTYEGPNDWVAAAQRIANYVPSETSSLVDRADEVVTTLLGEPVEDVSVHPTLRDALALLSASFPRKLHLRDLAGSLSMSESHLSRLFLRETGASYLATVRWARLLRGLVAVGDGATITEAAHAAGFADSAHATRVCREMAGVPPSDLLAMARWPSTQVGVAAGR